MSSPLFSILVPSYNRPELLISTIESVLAQTLRDFEIIVSDDASPRGPEILASVQRFVADERFKFVAQPENLGWSGNRNALLKIAKGEFVMFLGDDDLLPIYSLSRLAKHLNENANLDVIVFGYDVIDSEGIYAYSRKVPRLVELQVGREEVWREVFYYDVLPMWAFHPFTLCCRTIRAVQWGYDKRCGIGDDVYFLFRALDSGCRVDVLPEILFKWRRALKQSNGYKNLSSNTKANDEARIAVWELSQQTNWTSVEVKSLIGSEEFAKYFLGLHMPEASEVAHLGRVGSVASLERARACYWLAIAGRQWRSTRLSKLYRLYKIGGIQYVWFAIWENLAHARS